MVILIVGSGLEGPTHPVTSDNYTNGFRSLLALPHRRAPSGHTRVHDHEQLESSDGNRGAQSPMISSHPMKRQRANSWGHAMQPTHRSNIGGGASQAQGSERTIPTPMTEDEQNSDNRSAEDYLRDFGVLSERQIDNSLSISTRRIVSPMDRFMEEDYGIGNLHEFTSGLPPMNYQCLSQELSCLCLDSLPPHHTSRKPQERSQNRRPPGAMRTDAAYKPARQLDSQRQHRHTHGVIKKTTSRAKKARQNHTY